MPESNPKTATVVVEQREEGSAFLEMPTEKRCAAERAWRKKIAQTSRDGGLRQHLTEQAGDVCETTHLSHRHSIAQVLTSVPSLLPAFLIPSPLLHSCGHFNSFQWLRCWQQFWRWKPESWWEQWLLLHHQRWAQPGYRSGRLWFHQQQLPGPRGQWLRCQVHFHHIIQQEKLQALRQPACGLPYRYREASTRS